MRVRRIPLPALTPVDSLLAFADELERRDARIARALGDVERLQREVDELRRRAAAAAELLAALPALLDARAGDERSARAARAGAEAAVREAESAVGRARRDDDRLAAERALQEARDDLNAADRWVGEALTALELLAREGDRCRTEAAALEARAAELAAAVRDVPSPAAGLDGALDWASRARGALLLERSGLAGEREKVVREANELLGSVLGEPLTATAVAGVRDRLARALRQH